MYRRIHVRTVIHDVNERGFESLRPRFGSGRPHRISSGDVQRIVAVAGVRPDSFGVSFSRRSPAKLTRYLDGQGIAISLARLQRILARAGVSLRRTRSWKRSPDREDAATAARTLELYHERPRNGVVVSFDYLSCPWTKGVREYAAANIELVPTPSHASFLNRIESHFGEIDEFVCKNADYPDWDAFGFAVAAHILHRSTPQARAARRPGRAATPAAGRTRDPRGRESRRLSDERASGATL